MLDLLEDSLKESSFQYRRFDGKMSMEARHKSIEEFKNLPELVFKVSVFLSLMIFDLWSLFMPCAI
ncbi:BnaA09g48010D [Brassica napus]|uniref:BnaA09g48010D protein n=3 Tax=Brassica TaxID=3705 RepID=A0A078H8Q9_BRANA|nr:BnaA09g48010D [Brassica napus]VDC64194.1 unnamed protein product [Brassica rapa]